MNEFSYGSPHPLRLDLLAGKYESNKRTARLYVEKLSLANALFHAGSGEMTRGLALFDLESSNIRRWQAWSARASEANPGDEFTAGLCRDFGQLGSAVLEVRLHPTDIISWAEGSIRACRSLECPSSEAPAFNILGTAWLALGDTIKAIGFFEQALKLAREALDFHAEFAILDNLGSAYVALGDARKAIALHENALSISQEILDRFSEGKTLGNLGNAWLAVGDYQQAIEFHERALSVARETGDRIAEGGSLNNLGAAWVTSGDILKGVEYFDQCLQLAKQTGNRSLEGSVLGNWGGAWIAIDNATQAVECFEEALEIIRETGNRRNEGRILSSLGNAWVSLGNVQSAVNCFEQSLAISRATGDRLGEAKTMFIFANAMHRWGHIDPALFYVERAIDIFEELESPLADMVRRTFGKWLQAIDHTQAVAPKQTIDPTQTVVVLLVRGVNTEGNAIFAYVAIRLDKLEDFTEAQKTDTYYPEDYGVVIETGEGEPSEEVKQRMTREYGFNHEQQIDPANLTLS